MDYLGDILIDSNENVVGKEETLKGKIVLLLFSSAWCPPCADFLTKLIGFYQNMKNNNHNNNNNNNNNNDNEKEAEIVFISSDRNEEAFKNYFGLMPWFALPYHDRQRKTMLSQRYNVTGIPCLVVIDWNGKLITKEGRQSLMKNPNGFPWRKPPLHQIVGDVFISNNNNNDKITKSELGDFQGNIIGLYFSSEWCPPCLPFFKELAKSSEVIQANHPNQRFQIIFVSSDKNEEAFWRNFKSMPSSWLAIPYNSNKAQQLSQSLNIDGVPALVIVDDKFNVLNYDGRVALLDDPQGIEFPWALSTVNKLKTRHAATINKTTSLLLLSDSASESHESQIFDLLTQVANENIVDSISDSTFLYFYGFDSPVVRQLQMFLGDDSFPSLYIVNIAQNLKYRCELSSPQNNNNNNNNNTIIINADLIRKFIRDFQFNQLKPAILH